MCRVRGGGSNSLQPPSGHHTTTPFRLVLVLAPLSLRSLVLLMPGYKITAPSSQLLDFFSLEKAPTLRLSVDLVTVFFTRVLVDRAELRSDLRLR